jgi:hypothetical protein
LTESRALFCNKPRMATSIRSRPALASEPRKTFVRPYDMPTIIVIII